jgi:hypothetical protein
MGFPGGGPQSGGRKTPANKGMGIILILLTIFLNLYMLLTPLRC